MSENEVIESLPSRPSASEGPSAATHIEIGIYQGLIVGLAAGLVNSLGVAMLFGHLFERAADLVKWSVQLTGWYLLLMAAGMGVMGALVGFLDLSGPHRNRESLGRFYFYSATGAVILGWATTILNFGWLPRPLKVDALHVTVNGFLLVVVAIMIVGLVRKVHWPGCTSQSRTVWAVAAAVMALALTVLGPLVVTPRAVVAGSEIASAASHTASAVPTGDGRSGEWNLLLITVDTLRADHLGFYGYPRDTSPYLDSLAAEGAVFDRVFAEKPRTSPSFASIMTSTRIRHHGIHNTYEVLAPEHLTLAEVLQASGYTTAGVIANGNLYPTYGFDQGFQEYFYGERTAEEQTGHALEWLERKPHEPFFLWVHYIDPHSPYTPPPPYNRRYLGDAHYRKVPIPREFFTEVTPSPLDWISEASEGLSAYSDEGYTNLDWHIAQYDGEIRYTDDQIGRLLNAFAERGLLERTLLVFSSDHGEIFGEQGFFGHGSTAHDSNSRIPLFFRLPAIVPAGERVAEVTGGVDIAPTILDLLGLLKPSIMQGVNRAAWIREGVERHGDSFAITEAGFGVHIDRGIQQALRTRDWKYVWRDTAWSLTLRRPQDVFWFWNAMLEGGLDSDELYDLRADPEEKANRIRQEPNRAKEMKAQLLSALERQGPAARPARAIGLEELEKLSPETEKALRTLGYVK